jgi:hypothetical protein
MASKSRSEVKVLAEGAYDLSSDFFYIFFNRMVLDLFRDEGVCIVTFKSFV